MKNIFLLLLFITVFFIPSYGFDLSESIVDVEQFFSGGVNKDDIPAISNPKFISSDQAKFLNNNDLIIGVIVDGQAKAYPVNILNWHEIVNDQVGRERVAITWCPLTKSAVVFDRQTPQGDLEFGVSGILYNNNLVMYDRLTDSLWLQLLLSGATSNFAGYKLQLIPSVVTTFRQWKRDYPQSLVLSTDTGFHRDYTYDPYEGYHKGSATGVLAQQIDPRLEEKELVIGIDIDGIKKAYPLSELKMRRPIEDVLGSKEILVYGGPNNTAYITDKEGNLLSGIITYWFAWSVFNPDTLIFGQE